MLSLTISLREGLSDVLFDVSDLDNFVFLLDGSLLDSLLDLFAEELNVAVGGKVGVNSTMGSVGSSSTFHGLVDNDVSNNEVIDIKSLGLGIRDSVLEEGENVSHGLLGPSTLGQSPLFSLAGSTGAALVFGEGDTSSVGENFVQILLSLLDEHATNGLSGLVSVLEVDSKVESFGAAS